MELDIESVADRIYCKCSSIHSSYIKEYDDTSLYIVALFEADQASLNEIKDVFDVAIKEMEDYGFIMTSNTICPTELEGLEYWLEVVPRTKRAIINYLTHKPMVEKFDNLEEKSLAELVKIIEQLNNK